LNQLNEGKRRENGPSAHHMRNTRRGEVTRTNRFLPLDVGVDQLADLVGIEELPSRAHLSDGEGVERVVGREVDKGV
jgi:hypothetical protein